MPVAFLSPPHSLKADHEYSFLNGNYVNRGGFVPRADDYGYHPS